MKRMLLMIVCCVGLAGIAYAEPGNGSGQNATDTGHAGQVAPAPGSAVAGPVSASQTGGAPAPYPQAGNAPTGQAAGPGSAAPAAGPGALAAGNGAGQVAPAQAIDIQSILAAYNDLKTRYAQISASTDTNVRHMLWAALIAVGLKYLLDILQALSTRIKSLGKYMGWIATGTAVPIALLTHFAGGSSWFSALLYAGAGPGAVVFHELISLFDKSSIAPAIAKQAGTAAILMLGFGLVHTAPGCGPNTPSPAVIGGTVIECGQADQGKLLAVLDQLKPLLSGGHVDWHAIGTQLKSEGVVIGGCVFAQLVQDYLGGVGAPQAEASNQARSEFESFRATVAGGATFHVGKDHL